MLERSGNESDVNVSNAALLVQKLHRLGVYCGVVLLSSIELLLTLCEQSPSFGFTLSSIGLLDLTRWPCSK